MVAAAARQYLRFYRRCPAPRFLHQQPLLQRSGFLPCAITSAGCGMRRDSLIDGRKRFTARSGSNAARRAFRCEAQYAYQPGNG
ncbi:hypothetical protein KCP70_16905 [Salmonella enterica subsp. enterica]|nr:hypothetical protein KCP70_16905 [Salmonella enterica subsp. enterica]